MKKIKNSLALLVLLFISGNVFASMGNFYSRQDAELELVLTNLDISSTNDLDRLIFLNDTLGLNIIPVTLEEIIPLKNQIEDNYLLDEDTKLINQQGFELLKNFVSNLIEINTNSSNSDQDNSDQDNSYQENSDQQNTDFYNIDLDSYEYDELENLAVTLFEDLFIRTLGDLDRLSDLNDILSLHFSPFDHDYINDLKNLLTRSEFPRYSFEGCDLLTEEGLEHIKGTIEMRIVLEKGQRQ